MNKKLKVFIAGHNGMVGRSLTNYLKKKRIWKNNYCFKKEIKS